MKWLYTIPIFLVGFVVFASLYLQPSDFSRCGESPSSDENCQVADAIVVVSGGDTTARTNAGIALYETGWADKLIFSGAAQDTSGPSNAETMRQLALAQGVPNTDIILDKEATNTHQNAQNTYTILGANGYSDMILVTSGYHQRRASLEFNQQAPDMTIRNYPVTSDKDWNMFWWVAPRGWWLATSETVKVIAFHFGVNS